MSFFLQEILCGLYPTLKFLNLCDVAEIEFECLKLINILMLNRGMTILVNPKSDNTKSYFQSLKSKSKEIWLEPNYDMNDFKVLELISLNKNIKHLTFVIFID
jgi:hypothetical protein